MTRKGHMPKFTKVRRRKFLWLLEEGAMISKAAEAVGVSRQAIHKARKRDAEFDKAITEALGASVSVLEDEATRRALHGIDKPITYQGEITATFKEYSDTLLLRLLETRAPDRWKPRSATEVSGQLKTNELHPLEMAQRLTAILARASSRNEAPSTVKTAADA